MYGTFSIIYEFYGWRIEKCNFKSNDGIYLIAVIVFIYFYLLFYFISYFILPVLLNYFTCYCIFIYFTSVIFYFTC